MKRRSAARGLTAVAVFAALVGTVIALGNDNWPVAGLGATLCLAGLLALAYVG